MSILGNLPKRRSGRWWDFGQDSLDLLPDKTRRALAVAGDQYDAWPGQTLLRAGAPVEWVFIVLDGEVAVRRDGNDVRILGPGSFYGALDIYGHVRSRGDLVARDLSRLVAVPSRAFSGLVATDAAFADWIIRGLAAEERAPVR